MAYYFCTRISSYCLVGTPRLTLVSLYYGVSGESRVVTIVYMYIDNTLLIRGITRALCDLYYDNFYLPFTIWFAITR